MRDAAAMLEALCECRMCKWQNQSTCWQQGCGKTSPCLPSRRSAHFHRSLSMHVCKLCVDVLNTCAVSVAQARHKPDHCHSNLTNFANSFDPGKCDSLPLKQSACYSMSSIAERRA